MGPPLRVIFALASLGCSLAAPGARAQSFDCTKARTAAEKAICGQPSLGALDQAVAGAFARSLAVPGTDGAALRAGQLAWLRERDAGCQVPAPRLAACLTTALSARLVALAPAPVASAAPASTPAPSPAAAFTSPSVPSANNPPAAEATLDRAVLPASSPGDTLLHVRVPGRFSIAARSASGTAIQVVDMMSGPAEAVGQPGARDGRTDVLLDAGTYKLRTLPQAGATGDVQLSVTPFADAAAPTAIPAPGERASATLADLQQRAFWLAVGPDGLVRIDAVGRALADLRLWAGGTDLVPLEPRSRIVEAVRGHPMLGLRLAGTVEPGTYLVTAYGGAPSIWADGAAEMPFHLRAGLSPRLLEGAASGSIGPAGSELFAAPPRAGLFRLDLPEAAAATLGVDGRQAAIAANSREPHATLRTDPNRAVVEVSGAAGQAFRLRAQEVSALTAFNRPGRWWIGAAVVGAGGEEAPPTALLLQPELASGSRVVASTAPQIRAGSPWRTQFNVRGPTTLLLQNESSGELAVRSASQGLGVLEWRPHSAQFPAGFTEYAMAPPAGRQGVADLLFSLGAAPATSPAPVAAWPADPIIPFGVQTIEPGRRLELAINTAPGLQAGLLARPAPVALAEGPLLFAQMPGVALDIPVRIAPGGSLAVSDAAAGPLDVAFTPAADGTGTVSLPAPGVPRTVVLAWRPAAVPRPAIPAPPTAGSAAALDAGTPQFLDLRDGEQRSVALTVPEGGLYRVETTGRLHTTATIGTAFAPALDKAEANGLGANALLQRWLRAGSYRVRVGASASAGHLGVQATRAPMRDGAELVSEGSIRAAIPAGTGLATPVVITEAGQYRLELLGQDRAFNARLDDADGWPQTAPGPFTTIERAFEPGRYRLLVSPEAVDARVVARLRRMVPTAATVGHGPHPLLAGTPAHAVWREPAGRADARTPDKWTFVLAGAADATLFLTDGMVADLVRDDGDKPILRLVGPTPWRGKLEPGRYRVAATSLGRNDRLDYTLRLNTAQVQPGLPRRVVADSQTPFTLARPGVVSLTTFGTVPLKAVLRDGAGAEVARTNDRGDDWNIAISRPLPAGAYRLDLAPAVPPDLTDVRRRDPVTAPANDDTAGNGDDKPDPDPGEPAGQSTPDAQDRVTDDSTPDASGRPTTELTFSLPVEHDDVPAPAGTVELAGGGVHRLAIPPPGPGRLLLASAQSSAALVLAIERQTANGWRTVALDQGTAPLAAVPSDTDRAAWRVSLWPVDGGTAPIRAAVQALDATAQALGTVTPEAVAAATPAAVARIRLDGPAPVRLVGGPLLAGGWPGHALETPDGGLAMPQTDTLWIVARTPAPIAATGLSAEAGQRIVLPIPAGGIAHLSPPASSAGMARAWRVEAGTGQPGIDAGQGMGVAAGSALAVGTAAPRLWNAGGDAAMRTSVTLLALATLPAQRLDAPLTMVLPPGSALPLTLPDGDRRTDLVLAPGLAAVAGHGAGALTVWTGTTAEARSLPGDWTDLMLLNAGSQPAAASVSWMTAGNAALKPGAATKLFIGAAGSFDLPLEAPAGAHLRTAGEVQATFLADNGQVLRGSDFAIPGNGRLTIAHAPGPLAVWLDAPGTSAWPAVSAAPAFIPSQVALRGPAMALSLAVDEPKLLHARTTAPVILTLGEGPPTLFPAGAVLNRYVDAATTLRIDSPHDGPLSGTLELQADPVTRIEDGLGAPVALAPGESAVFAFQVARAGMVGVGVRADPDRAEVRLLAADGTALGAGAASLRRLEPGRYLVEVRLPADALPTIIRPAVVGIAPRKPGPPPEVARSYLELVGLAPKDGSP